MIPNTLSASAASTYEACPAMYKANYIDRVPGRSGDAAGLGTAVHAVLERWITEGFYLSENTLDKLLELYKEEYARLGLNKLYNDGTEMLKNWYGRQDWEGKEVLSCEIKETFPLKISGYGEIPFTYIWDRCDQLDDGAIEVVDYKTIRVPLDPDELKMRIQPRAYAVAAYMKYPNAKEIWVSYDQIRHDIIGIRFSIDECRETYAYLQRMARRILADDGVEERLNPECRYCVRGPACETLTKHVAAGGEFAIQDIDEAIDRRAALDYAAKAIQSQMDSLDAFIMEAARDPENGFMERKTENTIFKIGGRKFRKVDMARVTKAVDPKKLVRFTKMGIGDYEKMIESGLLDDLEKKNLEGAVRSSAGKPSIQTKPRNDVSDGL